jgi:hypothetical protein
MTMRLRGPGLAAGIVPAILAGTTGGEPGARSGHRSRQDPAPRLAR